MTRFGITATLAAFGLIMIVILKPETAEGVDVALLIMAAFLLGALVAIEAREQHVIFRRNGKEHDASEEREE